MHHSSDCLEAAQVGFGVKIQLCGVTRETGGLCAVCRLDRRGSALFSISGQPLPRLLTTYQGPVWLPETDENLKANTVDALYRQARASYLRLRWCPVTGFPADSHGFEWAQTATLDLSVGGDLLLKGMKGETRIQGRQGCERGTKGRFTWKTGKWCQKYGQLSQRTYARQGLCPALTPGFLCVPFAASSRHSGALTTLNWGGAGVLAAEGRIVAAALIIFDGMTIYYLDNVSGRQYQQYRANNVIVWEIVRWGVKFGYMTVYLVGADIPSIAAFKLGFGAHAEAYPTLTRLTWVGRAALDGFRKGKKLLKTSRRLFRQVPSSRGGRT